MKALMLALFTLSATAAFAAPTFPSGRYSGTAVLIVDQVGCVAHGVCSSAQRLNFNFRNNGVTGLYVSSTGKRYTLKRQTSGGYGGIIATGGDEHCSYISSLNLFISNRKNAINLYVSFSCDDGTHGIVSYLGFPRKVG